MTTGKISKRLVMVLLAVGALGMVFGFSENTAKPVSSDGLVRLHVIANSDNIVDQKIKLLVRDEVIKYMAPIFSQAKTASEARELAERYADEIQAVAEHCLNRMHTGYSASVQTGCFNFPTKAYGRQVFPAGEYQAVRVVLGSGQGKNWWCVLYPPLCFVSITNCVTVEREPGITMSQDLKPVHGSPVQIKVRFKILDRVKNFFAKKFSPDPMLGTQNFRD